MRFGFLLCNFRGGNFDSTGANMIINCTFMPRFVLFPFRQRGTNNDARLGRQFAQVSCSALTQIQSRTTTTTTTIDVYVSYNIKGPLKQVYCWRPPTELHWFRFSLVAPVTQTARKSSLRTKFVSLPSCLRPASYSVQSGCGERE